MFYEVTVDEYYTDSGVPDHIYFPKKVTVKWGDLKKGADYDKDGTVTAMKSKSFTQGRPAMPFNINDLGLTLLQSKLGFNAKLATVVNELRKSSRFNSELEFRIRVEAYYANHESKKATMTDGFNQLSSRASEVVFDDAN